MFSKQVFWTIYHTIFLCLFVFIIWISGLNYEGLKYSRVKTTAPQTKGYEECDNLVLELQHPNSWICCDDSSHNGLWICSAINDNVTRFLSGHLAWIIPLAPLLLTIIVDAIVSRYRTPNNESRKQSSLSGGLERFKIYISCILLRSFVLYYLPYKITDTLYHSSPLVCWAEQYISRTKCQMVFDFSDHIVLFCVQYMFPSFLEALHICSTHGLVIGDKDVGSRTAYGIAKNLYWIPLIVSTAIIVVSLRCMMFTMLFFHNPLENIVALAVVSLFPYLFFLLSGPPRQFLEKCFCS